MEIAIRVDSATMIGSGHVMRCLTLAKRLRKSGANVRFICRELPGHIINIIESSMFTVHVLPFQSYPQSSSVDQFFADLKQDYELDLQYTIQNFAENGLVEWVVVDHYALDEKWELAIRPYTNKIWVIDDLADRQHHCDVLLDQNYHANQDERYEGLVPRSCKQLLGPQYLLLREEFFYAQHQRRQRDGFVQRILVFFGGSDPTNETKKTIDAIRLLGRSDIHFDIVVGTGNVHRTSIEAQCALLPNVAFHFQINNMADLMNAADLAIGAGGSTTWERCFLGLPALIVILADNQRDGIEKLASYGAFINLGWHEELDSQKLQGHIVHIITKPDLLKSMNVRAMELVGASKGNYKDKIISQFGLKNSCS